MQRGQTELKGQGQCGGDDTAARPTLLNPQTFDQVGPMLRDQTESKEPGQREGGNKPKVLEDTPPRETTN